MEASAPFVGFLTSKMYIYFFVLSSRKGNLEPDFVQLLDAAKLRSLLQFITGVSKYGQE